MLSLNFVIPRSCYIALENQTNAANHCHCPGWLVPIIIAIDITRAGVAGPTITIGHLRRRATNYAPC